ncbi:MAG TPA: zinc-ribbon domain-containing protein [Myxococcaceae bacterium]|nr:zinc-ribbon domain-containing protein [Myxococcaceae bacterium]
MIVQCSQCQTRFRIPDEKVTDRGVKVRCTRCQHTFRVTRDGPESEDPFAGFGVGVGPAPLDSTRPGVDARALAASRQPAQGENTRVMSQAHAAEQLARMEAAEDPLPRPPPVTTPAVPRPPSVVTPADVPRPPSLEDLLGSAPAPANASPAGAASGTAPFATPVAPASPAAGAPPDFGAGPMGVEDDPFAHLPIDPPGPAFGDDPFAALPQAKSPTDPFGGLPPPVSPTMPFGDRTRTADGPGVGFSPFDDDAAAEGPETNTDLRAELFGAGLDAPDRPLPQVGSEPLLDLPAPTREVAFAAPGVQRVRLKVATPAPTPDLSPVPPVAPTGASRSGARGIVVNVLLGLLLVTTMGAVLLAVANEGNLSLENWRAGLPTGPLAAKDVSNGLYATGSGEMVFFVRGEVENGGAASMPAEVRVEIYDGDTLLRRAVALVGAAATPEDLHGLATEADVQALRARLDRDARALAPGERAPFLVAFLDYPPALERYRFNIVAAPASELPEAGAPEEEGSPAEGEPVSEATDV